MTFPHAHGTALHGTTVSWYCRLMIMGVHGTAGSHYSRYLWYCGARVTVGSWYTGFRVVRAHCTICRPWYHRLSMLLDVGTADSWYCGLMILQAHVAAGSW